MNKTALFFAIFGAFLLIFSLKKGRFLCFFLTSLTGIAAFFAADYALSFFNGNIPLNYFSLSVSIIGGIPGVILLILLNTFL